MARHILDRSILDRFRPFSTFHLGRSLVNEQRKSSALVGLLVLPVLLLAATLMPEGIALAAEAPDALRVLQSSSETLRVGVEGLDLQWREMSLRDGAVLMHDPSLPGFSTVGEPGEPRVPRQGGWFVVPPGTRPELVTIGETWRSEAGQRLLVQTLPVMIPGDEPGLGGVGEILVLPGEQIPPEALVAPEMRRSFGRSLKAASGPALVLGTPRWWRGRRICSWTLLPLQHDAQGQARQSLEKGTWEIRFRPDKTGEELSLRRSGLKTTTHGDENLGSIFLNKELLGSLPTEAVASGVFPRRAKSLDAQGGKKGSLLGNMEGRLAVTRTGLFKVTHALLNQLGYIPGSGVQESEIRLYQRRYLERLDDGSGQAPYVEVEVPIRMVGGGDDFSGEDYFLFYGLRMRDDGSFTADVGDGPEPLPGCGDQFEMNNSANIYWVAAAEPDTDEQWARMATTTYSGATGAPLESYRRTDHFESTVVFRENLPSESGDRIYANLDDEASAALSLNPLWTPDPSGADVDLAVGYAGYRNSDRELEFTFVDADEDSSQLEQFLHEEGWDDAERFYSLTAGDFAGERAKVVMTSPASSTRVQAFLNWVEATYDALFQAVDGELPFHTGLAGGAVDIEVTGFTSGDLGLVLLDDPREPVWVELSAANVLTDGDGYKLSLHVNNALGVTSNFYVAQDIDDSGFPQFAYYESSRAEDQTNPTEVTGGGNPDVVVVSHAEFMDALPRWVEHRRQRAGGDLDVHVVDVQDLYDWYSGGMRDPWAVKRFANHAIEVWGSYALVIIGDANENARELKIQAAAQEWATDWVPTHYHTQQALTYLPELMASDKWYATHQSGQNYPVEDFPDATYSPWEMYVGRIPCNSVEELNLMIDKIILVETPAVDQDWRKRAIFFGDDAWSNADNPAYLEYNSDEVVFAGTLRDSVAPMWRHATGVPLLTTEEYLADYLDPYWEGHGTELRRLTPFKNYTESDALPPLLAALSGGGLLSVYQGHANAYVLASENWLVDRLGGYRTDMGQVNNGGKPWFFIGLGCHISDWAQSPTYSDLYPRERSLSEKFMVLGGGAVATYGSPGYEYIINNAVFSEIMFYRWLHEPPSITLDAKVTDGRSRWMLGELMWAAEADILAILGGSNSYREMVAQYTLLGDPLMMLDTGPAQVTARFTDGSGETISGNEVDLVAVDASNTRTISLQARDEAGIDRLEVVDDQGNDLTAQVSTEFLPEGATDHQIVNYDLVLPVNPYDHTLTVRVFDTGGALATDRHYELVLNVNQTGEFLAGGEIVDPEVFEFTPGEPVAFSATFTGATWFHDGLTLDLSSTNLDLTDVVFTLDKSNEMAVDFTATAPVGTVGERSVDLAIGDFPATTYVLQAGNAVVPDAGISTVYNFPNPVQSGTRFLFTTDAVAAQGVVRVFSVAGRHVARIPFSYSGGGSMVIPWDGRDDDGDELGNGTYLYRVELEAPGQSLISDMQRLVVMR